MCIFDLLQVSFQLTIPCLLFTKTAEAVANAADGPSLLGIPACAVLLVLAGFGLGLVAGLLVEGRLPWGQAWFGWQAAEPVTPLSASVAQSMAQALGTPQVRWLCNEDLYYGCKTHCKQLVATACCSLIG